MADKKIKAEILEREYIIPLRREWRKVANYRRTGRAVKTIKKFIARHMKVPERDLSKVKLDIYLNQEIWFRGRRKPPAKIKVKAVKENDVVNVTLVETPIIWKFEKLKHSKTHTPVQTKMPVEHKAPETEQKSEEEKQEEKEKSKSSAEMKAKEAKQEAKAQKHTTKAKDPGFHRMALKK